MHKYSTQCCCWVVLSHKIFIHLLWPSMQHELNDRQVKALLDKVGSNYPGLLLHSNVHWLSRACFAACLREIRTEHPPLLNIEWFLQFYNLMDIIGFLSQLNVKIKSIKALKQAVSAFESKPGLLFRDTETSLPSSSYVL